MRSQAPGSVTTLFAPVEDGAHGVSFATEDGVVADVSPADGISVTLDGEPTDFEPVELACEALGVVARVDLTAEVPVGRGFGASGAATLATVLAARAEFGLGRDRDELVEVAARAEIEAGTGLGDVYVQDLGGLVWNVGEGRQRRAVTTPVEYASFDAIATADVLGDEGAMDRVRAAADEAFAGFDPDAGLLELFERSWSFARATGLATDRVRAAVERVTDEGGAATMAMVGETVVVAGVEDLPASDGDRGLAGRDVTDGVLAKRTRITPEGARLLDG